jgi:hypothetical protein
LREAVQGERSERRLVSVAEYRAHGAFGELGRTGRGRVGTVVHERARTRSAAHEHAGQGRSRLWRETEVSRVHARFPELADDRRSKAVGAGAAHERHGKSPPRQETGRVGCRAAPRLDEVAGAVLLIFGERAVEGEHQVPGGMPDTEGVEGRRVAHVQAERGRS